MKELEQKLELERSSARRHESQISRLRHQLERLQDEKSEDVSHKSNDALNRSQKQIRELRAELQEAERKEQEMAKKKRGAVSNGHIVMSVSTMEGVSLETSTIECIEERAMQGVFLNSLLFPGGQG